ncbi:hypothetical protein ACFQ60_01960 [Streptomyces zhihengii]
MNITTEIHGAAAPSRPAATSTSSTSTCCAPPAAAPAHRDERGMGPARHPFADVAALHLLSTPGDPQRATSLANLQPQHRRLLTIACELFPDADFDRYLNCPGAPQAV